MLLQQQVITGRWSKKIIILEKVFLHSSCSELVIKNFKLPVKKFHLSVIIVLHAATLLNKELFHNHFSKILITIVKWYIIMVQWLCLKISKILWEEWQEYIKSGIAKRGNKIWRGMIPLQSLQSSSHAVFLLAYIS